MAPSDAKYEKLQSRDNYPRHWLVDLSATCYKRPGCESMFLQLLAWTRFTNSRSRVCLGLQTAASPPAGAIHSLLPSSCGECRLY
jgi:hypothetical protein